MNNLRDNGLFLEGQHDGTFLFVGMKEQILWRSEGHDHAQIL